MLTSLDAWRELRFYRQYMRDYDLKTEVLGNSERTTNLKFSVAGIDVDCTRNNISLNGIYLLHNLAKARNINSYIASLFSGDKVNYTESQAALHAALRSPEFFTNKFYSQEIGQKIHATMSGLAALVEGIRSGHILSANSKPIKNVVNIGIGGSNLGPKMVCHALDEINSHINTYFVSHIDPAAIKSVLATLVPDETLVIVVSKSFTTVETMTNARVAMEWLGDNAVGTQLIAITANDVLARKFGIAQKNIFPIWNWVGGRYSLWSAVGLSVALKFGMSTFRELLAGANCIDRHVISTRLDHNIPLVLALLDIWHVNFLDCATRAIVPYIERAKFLPDYLQQLMMESNGKSVTTDAIPVDYQTCPVIWGGVGSDSQHAFHQLLMQGTNTVPVDLIYQRNGASPDLQEQQDMVQTMVKAQSDALLFGNLTKEKAIFKQISGNNSHTIFSFARLDAYTLGALLAIYEYRTILSAAIWNINPFDQYGVELGKVLAREHEAVL